MGLINCSDPHAADAGVPRHGAMLPRSVLERARQRGWSMAVEPMGNWHKLSWFGVLQMFLWSTTHVAPLFIGSHGNTSTKLWLVKHSGELGGKGRIRNARAAGWDRPRGCMRAEDKQLLHTYYMRLAKPLWRGRWTAHVAIVNPETSHCLFGAFWKRWRAISTGQGTEKSWPLSLWNPRKALLQWGHGQLNPITAAIHPTGSS